MRVRPVGAERWHPGRTVNLSLTGALVCTQHQLNVGERVELEINFAGDFGRPSLVTTLGRVVRLDCSVPGGAAIEFAMARDRLES